MSVMRKIVVALFLFSLANVTGVTTSALPCMADWMDINFEGNGSQAAENCSNTDCDDMCYQYNYVHGLGGPSCVDATSSEYSPSCGGPYSCGDGWACVDGECICDVPI